MYETPNCNRIDLYDIAVCLGLWPWQNPEERPILIKYPLTLHKTGQYCKKIKGKLYYFGTDKRQALERYLEQAFYLHSGEQSKVKSSSLLEIASVQIKAMIWLGLNCGFGCTDCAELKWKNLDLKRGRVSFPRSKTGIDRNLPLWPETITALEKVPKTGELVFYTRWGNPWVRTFLTKKEDGTEKWTKDDAVTTAFAKLIKKAKIQVPKGPGFYTLRRTAATLTAAAGDPFAVQRLLGHADLKMATTHVQDVSEQTDRAINNARNLIIQDGL